MFFFLHFVNFLLDPQFKESNLVQQSDKCNVLVPNKSILKNKIPCVVLCVECDMIIIVRKTKQGVEIVTLWSK